MKSRPFRQVDVFTDVATLGNPVAVVLDASGMDGAAMQRFAAWTNLSETTFVTPPTAAGADYAVRIFTPRAEMPFAGHPTLGTAHAVIESGLATPRNGVVVQECAVGLVDVTTGPSGVSFRLPRFGLTEVTDPAATAWIGAAIKGAAQAVDVGPTWLVAEVAEVAALEQLAHDEAALAAWYVPRGMTGATLFAVDGERVVVRSFAPGDGIAEDPVCGSGNASVAAFRLAAGQIGADDHYVASQGRQVGRDGRVNVRIVGGSIHVGGACVTCIAGTVTI